ncbi:unnamed protein product [Phytophthora lilii]|uniref:Unnamed protein product n=1 Tax=Phytophthora lilii TaxID=2077276 RepID=A0A9W6UEN3_9STRA|nr:unnamed protein product [Phytophthora lilii]
MPSGYRGTSSSAAAAGAESSSPDGSCKPLSAAIAVEAHVAQARSGSHGVSSLASAESSSSAPSNSVRLSRLAVGLQVAPSIRGDRRVRSRVDTAKSLEEVVNAAVPCLDAGRDVTLDLATMRGQLYSAEAAQAAAENHCTKRFIVEKNAEVLAKTAFGERDSLRVELRRSKEAQAQLVKKVEQLNAIVATHKKNEVYAKLVKRVLAAEDHAQRTFQAAGARARGVQGHSGRIIPPSVRVSTVYWLIQMLPMIRQVLFYAFATRISWSGCSAADMETSVNLEFSSPAPSASRSNAGSRSSGVSKAKSKSRSSSSSEASAWSASTQVLSSPSERTTPTPRTPSAACRTLDLSPPSTGSSAAGTRRSSRASAAQSSFKSSLMRELEDANDEDVLGGSSSPLARPRSSFRPIVIDNDSDNDSESGVESERRTISENTVDSRVDNSRSAGSEASAVPRSNVAGHSPAREASASGALAPSDGSSTVPTSREVSVLPEVGLPPVAATRESKSPASTGLVVRDSSIPAPPSAKTGAVQKSAAKTQAKASKSSQKKKRARSAKAQSESSVPGVAPSESSAAARSSSSRSQSRRRQAKRPQVDASMSSLPGLDSTSLRPVSIPEPVHGDQPHVRFSKQVIKWARPYMTPKFKLPGASKCWSRILNCRLPIPVPSHTPVPCTAAQIEAFADYRNPRHPWQVVRRQLPPHACLFSTVDFDVSAKVSQRASFDQRLRSYWRSFRGFGDEEDADLGFALWERDHWIPARAVDLFFSHAFAVLANIRSTRFGPEDQARIRRELEAARAKWVVYLADRTKRCDRLRVKLVYKMWRWAVDENPALADIPPEVLFEPSIPGYSFEYLTWIPKSSAWLSEVSALDELQSWRTGWVGAPALHPPASPDLAQDASSATPRLATSNDTLVAPSTEDPDHLLFLAQVSAAADLAGEDGGGASEGS